MKQNKKMISPELLSDSIYAELVDKDDEVHVVAKSKSKGTFELEVDSSLNEPTIRHLLKNCLEDLDYWIDSFSIDEGIRISRGYFYYKCELKIRHK